LRKDSLSKILKEFDRLENYGKVGAVRSVGEKHRQSIAAKLDFFAWRGTLIKAEAVREAGLPRRDYFIYSDDLEYSLRLAKKGYIFYWAPLSKCTERRISGKTNNKIFGKAIKIYNEPFRLYYAFRNEIATCLRYNCLNRLSKILLYALKVSLYISFFYKRNCSEKLKAIREGLRDGFYGKLGKNVKYLPEGDG
jgi:GT2 family glycosyltransferase